uniref:Uncharacterized protein n=1 Tax=Oryza sativa subsp. japonica TaxID=39947 RepID=Q75G63_ORYSJ|nr:hypothetical protein [Oryza sativa Japonica Group]
MRRRWRGDAREGFEGGGRGSEKTTKKKEKRHRPRPKPKPSDKVKEEMEAEDGKSRKKTKLFCLNESHRKVRITGGGGAVEATVVDECDSRRGCKDDVVDSSPAVWRAMGRVYYAIL